MTEEQGTTLITLVTQLDGKVAEQQALMAKRDAWLMLLACALFCVLFFEVVKFVRSLR